MFDKIAYRYDLLNRLLSFQQDKRWRRALINCLPRHTDGKLVDVACGTGDVLQEILKARPQYSKLVGVDISAQMLDRAKHKLPTRVELKQMAAQDLQLPSEFYDALTISFGFRNVVDKEQALQEFHRVLKPQGCFAILEFFPAPSKLWNQIFQLYFHHILPFIGGCLSNKQAYSYLPKSVDSFYTPKQFLEITKKTGFQLQFQRKFLWGSCLLLSFRKVV